VRRALELAPKVFDGGVDWEGTDVSEEAPNLLTDLPPAVLNWPDYSVTFDPSSTAAKNIMAAGYPPDIVLPAIPAGFTSRSMWGNYSNSYWEVTECQWQKRLDPAYNTYVSGMGTYNYTQRRSFSDVGANMGDFATTGDVKQPLITVAGTMDGLLPIDHHARAYARKVEAARADANHGEASKDEKERPYRLYEVQNGNHIETYQDGFPQSRAHHAACAEGVRPPRPAGGGQGRVAAEPMHPAWRRHRRRAGAIRPLRTAVRALDAAILASSRREPQKSPRLGGAFSWAPSALA
jgi:hypothetical protein